MTQEEVLIKVIEAKGICTEDNDISGVDCDHCLIRHNYCHTHNVREKNYHMGKIKYIADNYLTQNIINAIAEYLL